jgi:hypothetical protein
MCEHASLLQKTVPIHVPTGPTPLDEVIAARVYLDKALAQQHLLASDVRFQFECFLGHLGG